MPTYFLSFETYITLGTWYKLKHENKQPLNISILNSVAHLTLKKDPGIPGEPGAGSDISCSEGKNSCSVVNKHVILNYHL